MALVPIKQNDASSDSKFPVSGFINLGANRSMDDGIYCLQDCTWRTTIWSSLQSLSSAARLVFPMPWSASSSAAATLPPFPALLVIAKPCSCPAAKVLLWCSLQMSCCSRHSSTIILHLRGCMKMLQRYCTGRVTAHAHSLRVQLMDNQWQGLLDNSFTALLSAF